MENKTTAAKEANKNIKIVNVPILNIRRMSDDEWNKLAYKNWQERQGK